jgi:hypothetical protein
MCGFSGGNVETGSTGSQFDPYLRRVCQAKEIEVGSEVGDRGSRATLPTLMVGIRAYEERLR